MIILKDYQETAVKNLVSATQQLLDQDSSNKLIVFKSPTGSGKTVMISKYVEKIISISEENLCFLWISIGKGNLHEQSRMRINDILEGNPTCKLLEEVIPDGEIKKNQIVIVNWEKLNQKKEGDWHNIVMRDGEKTNFHDVIEKTLLKRKIILIIDESHTSADTQTSVELKDIIQPEITINMTATPQYIPVQGNEREVFVGVSIESVIREGVIKKEVLINDTLEKEIIQNTEESKEVLEIVLDMAIRKREDLHQRYKSEKNDASINPLCLIQIPNAQRGDEITKELKTLLKKRGVSLEKRNLAIWTADQSENLVGINSNDSPVDYLIFKMAIATGWDCPRAQVLLKLRDAKSEVFDIQTIGRILRMPERVHYPDEALNKAYIYTNNADIYVNVENMSMVKWLKAKIKPGMNNVELVSYDKRNNKNMLIDRRILDPIFYRLLEENLEVSVSSSGEDNVAKLKDHSINTDMSQVFASIVNNGRIDSIRLDTEDHGLGYSTLEISIASNDIDRAFINELSAISPRMYESLKSLWVSGMAKIMGVSLKTKGVQTKLRILYLNNKEMFGELFYQVRDQYEKAYLEQFAKKIDESYPKFLIKEPKIQTSEGIEVYPANHHIFDNCFLKADRSRPEKLFEEFMEKSGDNIQWWYKNEDSGNEHFAVRYEYDGEPHAFFPDYLVLFKDGTIGIYETKSEKDRDGKTITKAKAEALQVYMKNLKGGILKTKLVIEGVEPIEEIVVEPARLDGGIVILTKDNRLLINREAEYNLHDECPGDWRSLAF